MSPEQRGRVLVVGARTAREALLARLSESGFTCASAEDMAGVPQAATSLQPEVILLATAAKQAAETLEGLRSIEQLRHVPILADVSRSRSPDILKKLAVDGFIRGAEEMVPRVEAAVRAGRLRESEERTRLRMGMLLEITQAATSSLEMEEILHIAVDKVGRVTGSDRCSVVLVEGSHARTGTVVATQENPSLVQLEIEIVRYPELRRALETRQPVLIEKRRMIR
ncbi:GAF domain-containing protein [Stigmatella aurantiaca]|nr:GAF domain-containing protein [Stigmatella aurantiaca]